MNNPSLGEAPAPPSLRYTRELFHRIFLHNLATCRWEPHPLHSVFTQYDQEYYLRQREAFLHKYRCFYALAKTVVPRSIVELGTCAGSSADAYLSAVPNATYLGIDLFNVNSRHDDETPWDPYAIAQRLFHDRGYRDYELVRADLRRMESLPCTVDMVVIDAAHDFDNEYADLRLSMTARPGFIFVDDAADCRNAKRAIARFLHEDLRGRAAYTLYLDYIDGGLVIRMRD